MLSKEKFWGHPHILEIKSDEIIEGQLYITDKYFDTKEDLLKDIKAYPNKPDYDFTEVLNEVFGDG